MLNQVKIQKRRRLFFVAITISACVASLFFIIQNFRENIVFFYSPSEVSEKKIGSTKSKVRVGGLVKQGSVKQTFKKDKLLTEFVITDLKNDLKIVHYGIVPDLFREKQGVVAKGFVGEVGVFISEELLIKHDENYMPPEIANSLEK